MQATAEAGLGFGRHPDRRARAALRAADREQAPSYKCNSNGNGNATSPHHSTHELVPQPVHGQQALGVGRVGFDLATEPADVDVDGARVG